MKHSEDHIPEHIRQAGRISPIDWLHHFRLATAGWHRDKFIDELCRLFYTLLRDDLVGQLVAPFSGGRLEAKGAGNFVDLSAAGRLTSLESQHRLDRLFPRLSMLVPPDDVHIMVRVSPLPSYQQQQLIERGCNLVSFLRAMQDAGHLSGGDLEFLSICFEELRLEGALRQLGEYWSELNSLAPRHDTNGPVTGIGSHSVERMEVDPPSSVHWLPSSVKRPTDGEVVWPSQPLPKRLFRPPERSDANGGHSDNDESPMDVDIRVDQEPPERRALAETRNTEKIIAGSFQGPPRHATNGPPHQSMTQPRSSNNTPSVNSQKTSIVPSRPSPSTQPQPAKVPVAPCKTVASTTPTVGVSGQLTPRSVPTSKGIQSSPLGSDQNRTASGRIASLGLQPARNTTQYSSFAYRACSTTTDRATSAIGEAGPIYTSTGTTPTDFSGDFNGRVHFINCACSTHPNLNNSTTLAVSHASCKLSAVPSQCDGTTKTSVPIQKKLTRRCRPGKEPGKLAGIVRTAQ